MFQVATMTKSAVQERSTAGDEDIDPTVYIIPLFITFLYTTCVHILCICQSEFIAGLISSLLECLVFFCRLLI